MTQPDAQIGVKRIREHGEMKSKPGAETDHRPGFTQFRFWLQVLQRLQPGFVNRPCHRGILGRGVGGNVQPDDDQQNETEYALLPQTSCAAEAINDSDNQRQ